MKHILFGTALAIGLATAPALAVEKPAKDQQSQALGEGRTDNMFKSEDGTLQGKPVVDGPADWSHLLPDSASTGESTGASGDDAPAGKSEADTAE